MSSVAEAAAKTDLRYRAEGVLRTQATVALEFLKEPGCVEVERRRCWPSSGFVFEGALYEWHALAFQSEMETEL